MKKSIYTLLVLGFLCLSATAQTQLDKTYNANSIEKLDLIFKYPQLVKIKVWDKEEISVKGQVEIHSGQFDDDFELKSSTADGRLVIESEIKNIEDYKNYSVYSEKDKDGKSKTISVSKNGTTISSGSKGSYTNGINISIVLEVTVPQRMAVMIDARYGLVEVISSPKKLEIEARYGGVDVQVNEALELNLAASTQWGQIYSNLNRPIDMTGDDKPGKWIEAKIDNATAGQQLKVTSQYGNVYLRKN